MARDIRLPFAYPPFRPLLEIGIVELEGFGDRFQSFLDPSGG